MEILLLPIYKEEFEKIVKIKCNNIFEGLNKYSNGMLKDVNNKDDFNCKEIKFIQFLEEAFHYNRNKPIIIDFYIMNLNGEQILNLLKALDYEDQIILLENLKNIKNNTVYFKITSKKLIPFITKLNTRNIFFCTIYFTEKPCTIWGNYNLSFPCLFEDIENLKFYEKLAQKHGLNLNSINIKEKESI